MTLDILGLVNGIKFKNCRYYYTNSTPQKAVENFKLHNPNSPILLGELKETDTIQQGNQKSFLADDLNLKLF